MNISKKIKSWILNREFVQKEIVASRKQGMDIRLDIDRKEMGREALSKLLGFVEEDKILTYSEKTGMIFLGGEKLEPEAALSLRQEAELLVNTKIWEIFQNTIGDTARKAMFEKSQSFEDMRSGKMMLYNLSILKKVVDIFRSYIHKPK